MSDMSPELLKHLERIKNFSPSEFPQLMSKDNISILATVEQKDPVEYAAMMQRLHEAGFVMLPDLREKIKNHKRAIKTARSKQAKAESCKATTWPCALDYTKMNMGGVARAFLAARPRRIIYSDNVFYELVNGLFTEISPEALATEIRMTDPKDIIEPRNMAQILKGITHLVGAKARPFEWLDKPENAPEPKDMIVCKNGLLDLRTDKLLPYDGCFFATAVPEFEYARGSAMPLLAKVAR